MKSLIKQFTSMSYQSKLLLFTVAIYVLIIGITTIYSYARLDYVRSYSTPASSE